MTDEKVGLHAESVEHASELDSNVTGANQGDLLGKGLDIEETVAVDTVLGAGDMGRDGGVAAHGNQDLLGVDDRLGAIIKGNLDRVGRHELGPAVNIFDLVVSEVALIDAVETGNIGVALVLEGSPVEGSSLLEAEAVVLGLVNGFGNESGVEGDLLGYATVEQRELVRA